ncbi:MAG: ammonium transporter [Deltaproteobacteria bacterium]|nr:ammonium transporter [Planctomycetota bacterium]MCB9727474.1 ammonium transporter [Deltaproteobacteria bacterium]MCB9785470.1 ammonium transporter [Deltaproteobacteria bacterium]
MGVRAPRLAGAALFAALVSLSPLASAQGDMPTTDTGTTAWMLVSTALVLLMVPGLAMFYGGLVRTKNVLGTMMHSFGAMAVMGVLWVVCGYAMAFGPNALGGWTGWNPDFVMLLGIDDSIMPTHVPEYVFAMFQGKFAIITPAILAGAFAERVRFRGYLVLIALWGILVYNPLCHWVWAEGGFLFDKGAIDFAGGTVVHISAGTSGLVCALYLGARRGYPKIAMHPSNLVMTLIGAGLLWVGWFGFNAGSAVSSGLDTARALAVTQAAAAAGALAWIVIEALHHGKATSLGIVSGILAGLVAITPAAGVVQIPGAMILGVAAAIFCYGAILLKNRLGYDDSLDAFGIHGVGGIVGAILLTFFLRPSWVAGQDASWSLGHQLLVQAEGVLVSVGYAGVVTLVLVVLVDRTIGLRVSEPEEMAGLDHSLHGEHGYGLLNPN